MTAAYFEDHPTDPDKVILRKRSCPYCNDTPRTWVGLTEEDLKLLSAKWRIVYGAWMDDFAKDIEAKLKEKNNGQ
jgi:glutaredoxin